MSVFGAVFLTCCINLIELYSFIVFCRIVIMNFKTFYRVTELSNIIQNNNTGESQKVTDFWV